MSDTDPRNPKVRGCAISPRLQSRERLQSRAHFLQVRTTVPECFLEIKKGPCGRTALHLATIKILPKTTQRGDVISFREKNQHNTSGRNYKQPVRDYHKKHSWTILGVDSPRNSQTCLARKINTERRSNPENMNAR